MTQTPPDLPMRALFDAQYRASRSQIDVPLALRLDRLQRMRALIDVHGAALAEAVQADFGVRSLQLTEVADFFVLRALLGDLEKHTGAWMKPRRVSTPIYLQPASARIQRQPLGVIGVIGPWNYPLQLTLGPAATALAAGNRVMIKPSELTPHTSALMAKLVHDLPPYFIADGTPAEVTRPDPSRVLTGDPVHTTWNIEDRDGLFCGLWQSTRGKWRTSYTEWEYVYIHSGHSILTDQHGTVTHLKAGDRFIIRPGFDGTWDCVETTLKDYVIVE